MRPFSIFILRLILSIVLSVIVSYLFFKDITFVRVGGLACVLLGFAYLFEYTKKRDNGGGYGG